MNINDFAFAISSAKFILDYTKSKEMYQHLPFGDILNYYVPKTRWRWYTENIKNIKKYLPIDSSTVEMISSIDLPVHRK